MNLTLLPFDAIASDSDSEISAPDSKIDAAEVLIENTFEGRETLRLADQYIAILSQINKPQEESQRSALISSFYAKLEELKLQLQEHPNTLGLLSLENFSILHLDILQIPGGRDILRAYRLYNGSSLLQEVQTFAREGSPNSLKTFNGFLQAYLADTGEISAEELNLTAPVDVNIFSGLSPEYQATFFSTYRNLKGENILHLFPVEQFDEFADRVSDENLGYLLGSSDEAGISPWLFYIDSPLPPRLVKLITTRDSDCFNMTLLTPLAFADMNFTYTLQRLRALGVNVDQTDDFGNTAEMIDKAGYYYLPTLLTRIGAGAGLNEKLWEEVKRSAPYIAKLKFFKRYPEENVMFASEFSDAALLAVQSQSSTPLHRAFWQLDISNNQVVAESKQVWRSFFETYDSMPKEDAEAALPLSGRVLNAVSSGLLPDLQETRAIIISGASSFGIKFRKATPEEASVMVNGVTSIARVSAESCLYDALGMHLGQSVSGKMHKEKESTLTSYLKREGLVDENERSAIYTYCESDGGMAKFRSEFDQAFARETDVIKKMFFKSYTKSIDDDKRNRLFRHQLKCTVVALAKFGEACYNDGYDRFDKLSGKRKLDSDKVFGYIDDTLVDIMPMGVNARALYQNVKDHLAPDDPYLLNLEA